MSLNESRSTYDYVTERLNEEKDEDQNRKTIVYNNIRLTEVVQNLLDRIKRLEEEIAWMKR